MGCTVLSSFSTGTGSRQCYVHIEVPKRVHSRDADVVFDWTLLIYFGDRLDKGVPGVASVGGQGRPADEVVGFTELMRELIPAEIRRKYVSVD